MMRNIGRVGNGYVTAAWRKDTKTKLGTVIKFEWRELENR